MEEKVNVWKANLTNGLILGLVGVTYSIVIYFLDLSFNKIQGPVFYIIEFALLFFLLKSYRDNFLHGQITYGQSVGAGVIIFFYYAIIMAIFMYILYTVIDSGLVAKQLAFMEEELVKKGLPDAAIETAMKIQAKIIKPEILAPISIFSSMLLGVIFSLIVSIFVRKEGNPLIDAPEN